MSAITLGIIGSGQLGSLLCQAARKLKVKTIVISDDNQGPAQNYADQFIFSKYDDDKFDRQKIDNNVAYTKKFFARGSQYYFKRPILEARWDSSKQGWSTLQRLSCVGRVLVGKMIACAETVARARTRGHATSGTCTFYDFTARCRI